MADTIDKDLEKALKDAKGGKPMQFAFLPKGTGGKLLVAKTLNPTVVAQKKTETGATEVIKGRVVGEDGGLVFEVVKAPPTLKDALTKRVKKDAGLTVPVEVRTKADAEAAPAGAGGAAGAPLFPVWQAANEAVEGQLQQLQAALKASGDSDLVDIADKGLTNLFGNYKVQLMTALREVDAAAGPARATAAAKALPAVVGLRGHLAASEAVDACDRNPFGIAVSLRATLGGALTQLETTLQAQAAG